MYISVNEFLLSCLLEPDEALEAFKLAYRSSHQDPIIGSKLGRAYVKTHQYTKAINHYKEANMTQNGDYFTLDLAELYLKLKQYSNAEQTLLESRNSEQM